MMRGCCLVAFAWTCSVWAGGGPQNTLVIVNDNSAISLELGQYYQDQRGLPESHIVHVQTTTNHNLSVTAFSNEVVQPVLAYLASAGLSNQIDYLVLTRGMPYRITDGPGTNGSSAVLFYGFRTNGNPFTEGCVLVSDSRQDYFQSETAFTHAGAPSSNRYYLSTVLSGRTPDEARRALDRARASDGLAPTGLVALLNTVDSLRSVRWIQYDNALFTARFQSNGVAWSAYETNSLGNASNLVGYLTGATVEYLLASQRWVPGGLADSLTSYGGYLLDPYGQMSMLNWLAYGAAGSYGTVTEPCGYTEKFPHSLVHYWYGRGFNLAESYVMSVEHPYMGVIVGDPLTAPYARPPAVTVGGLLPHAAVTADVMVTVSATSADSTRPLSRIDALLDGRWCATVTNLPPAAGNEVSITINGTTCTATAQSGDSLERVATRLAEAINGPPPAVPYIATAAGDRIQIAQNAVGTSGAWVQVSAQSATGAAGYLSVFARSVFTNFLETEAAAREGFGLSGSPVSGDIVRLVITRLDGQAVTNQVVASAGDTALSLLTNLQAIVNADPQLQGSNGAWFRYLKNTEEGLYDNWLFARTNGWQGTGLHVVYSVSNQSGSTLTGPGFSDNFNDNADAMTARAMVFLSEGATNLSASWSLAISNLDDGPHELEMVAYEGTAVRVQGRIRVPFLVDRHTLECSLTQPVSGRYVRWGSNVVAEATATSPGMVTQMQLWVEGKVYAVTAAPPWSFVWSTTNYGAGHVSLQARAWDDGGRITRSAATPVRIYTDMDDDGLPDQWEYSFLGSATNGVGEGDADGDGFSNLDEFLADTDPQDSNRLLRVESGDTYPPFELVVPVTNSRRYWVEYRDAPLALPGGWLTASNALTVTNGMVGWLDVPTNAAPATNDYRFYRARAELP